MESNSFKVLALLILLAFFLSTAPSAIARLDPSEKTVIITNNHTNYLSIRCFSFDNDFDVVHLLPWGQYMFKLKRRVIYPSATMFNCSTNMGTFVAYRYDYECSKDEYESCDWRFDEESAYRWEPRLEIWTTYEYAPNYESLSRGGVVKGYYAN